MVKEQVKAKVSPTEWESMTDAEKDAAVRCHAAHCWQHIRNIFLAPMASAMSTMLKELLEDDLDAFSMQERVSTDMGGLLCADYKEFHQGCRYYKGAGMDFWNWARDTHPSDFLVPFERADGGRQDLDFDAAVPMYINRMYIVQFLTPRVFAKGHSNILEDSIFVTHTKVEYVAMIRASAIIDLRIAVPMRWIAGNGSKLKNWSPFSMLPVLSRIEAVFERASRDGRALLSKEPLGIFEPVAAEQPAFREFLEWMYEKAKVLSPDGKTPHLLYKEAFAELLEPKDPTNADATDLTIDFLRVGCAGGLAKLHDARTVLPRYLTSQDGDLTLEKQAQAHEDTMGCELSNDKFAESVFGTFDRMLKRCEGISREAAAALTHAMRHKAYSSSGDDLVKRRKSESERRVPLPPPPPGSGYCRRLPMEEQLSLVEYTRLTIRDRKKEDRADTAEHAAYVKANIRTNSQEQLEALITEFGYGLSFFERWKKRGVRSVGDLSLKLRQIEQENDGNERAGYQARLDWLRDQIEMRTRGLRWTEFKTKWSSAIDDSMGTVEQLTGHLKEILTEENEQRSAGAPLPLGPPISPRSQLPLGPPISPRSAHARSCRSVASPHRTTSVIIAGTLPETAPAPIMPRKTFKQLGTRTKQVEEFAEEIIELTPEELQDRAERARERLEAAGEIDTLEDQQPDSAPLFNAALIGVTLEINWRYWIRNDGKRKGQLIWCEGVVVEIADAKSTQLPKTIRKRLEHKPKCAPALESAVCCLAHSCLLSSTLSASTAAPEPHLLLSRAHLTCGLRALILQLPGDEDTLARRR